MFLTSAHQLREYHIISYHISAKMLLAHLKCTCREERPFGRQEFALSFGCELRRIAAAPRTLSSEWAFDIFDLIFCTAVQDISRSIFKKGLGEGLQVSHVWPITKTT